MLPLTRSLRHPSRSAIVAFTLAAAVLSGCDDDPSKPAETTDAAASDPRGNDNPTPNPPRPQPNPQANPPSVLPPAVPVEGPETELCGNTTCRDRLVGDIVVEPCCVNGDTCGLDLRSVSDFMPVTSGCVALEQPGSADATCPSVYFEDTANPRQLAGCCRPDGICGVIADLSDSLADFGCVDPTEFISGRGEQSPPGDVGGDPGVHLTDGGGFYVLDAGSSSPSVGGECVPRLPDPEPADAAVDAAPSEPTDAAPSEPTDASDALDASGSNPDTPDVGPQTTDQPTTPTQDAAITDAG